MEGERGDGAVDVGIVGRVEGAGDREASEAVAGEAADAGEVTADDDLGVVLLNEGSDEAVGVGRERWGGVAVAVDEGEVGEAGAADGGEGAADEDATVGLEAGKGASGESAAVGVGDDGVDGSVGAGVEAGVEDAVAVEDGEAGAAGAEGGVIGLEGGEIAADQNGAVAVGGDGIDGGVGRGVEVGIEGAVGIQAGDVVAGVGAEFVGTDGGEGAADDGFAVGGLEGDGVNDAVGHRVEARVEGAVGVEAGDVIAGGGRAGGARLEGGEGAAHEEFAVRLEGEGEDRAVGGGVIVGV